MPEGKNPILQNGTFFFSNMYDDRLLTEFYPKICRESWENAINSQYRAIGRRTTLQKGTRYNSQGPNNADLLAVAYVSEKKVDDIYNSKVGLPRGSATFKVYNFALPVYNKRRYVWTYGSGTRVIPIKDFLTKHDIFDFSVTVQMGRFNLYKAVIIENSDRTITLAIPNSSSYGIPSTMFNNMIDTLGYDPDEPETSDNGRIYIFMEEQTEAYEYSGTMNTIFSTAATDGYYTATISTVNKLTTFGKQLQHEEANSWDIFLSERVSQYGQYGLIGNACTLKETTSQGDLVFNVDEAFVNYIKSNNSAVTVYVIKRPNRRHVTIFTNPITADNGELIEGCYPAPYTYNPASSITLKIYEYDPVNHYRTQYHYFVGDTPSEIDNINYNTFKFVQFAFPNIISFTSYENKNLEFEVFEYYPTYTNQVMHNGLKQVYDNLGEDFYTKCLVNDYITMIDEIEGTTTYLHEVQPKIYRVSLEDYQNSIYYEDIRGYYCDKINKMIKSDPSLKLQYFDFMHEINKVICSDFGTPKYFRFGTNLTGEFTGVHGTVMDTSIASVNPDDIQYFEEAHSYIVYKAEDGEVPSMFYVDGKYVEPTRTRYYKGENYIFIPVSEIETLSSHYTSDKEVKEAEPLRLDWFPHSYNSYGDAPKDQFTVNSMSDQIKLFEHIDDPKFALSDLTLYDTSTGEFLDLLENFKVIYTVKQVIYQNPLEQNPVVIETTSEQIQYLMTVLDELYLTMDSQPIILGEASVDIDYDEEMEKINSELGPDSDIQYTNKKLDFHEVTLVPKNPNLIGKVIAVYNNQFKHTIYFDQSNIAEDGIVTIPDAMIDNMNATYFLFGDGNYIPFNFIDDNTSNNKFGNTLKIELGEVPTEYTNFKFVHIPVKLTKAKVALVNNLSYMGPVNQEGNSNESIWSRYNPESLEDGVIFRKSGYEEHSQPLEHETTMIFASKNLNTDCYMLSDSSIKTMTMHNIYYEGIKASNINIEYMINFNDAYYGGVLDGPIYNGQGNGTTQDAIISASNPVN